MKVYIVVYDPVYDHEDYIKVYSSEESAEMGILKDIVRRFDFSPEYDDKSYYNSLRNNYYIIKEELE